MPRTYRLLADTATRFAIALALAVGGMSFPNAPAAAKSKMTVKIPPEYTRSKTKSGAGGSVTGRDAASGLATGKRIHKPVRASDKKDGATNASHGSLLRGNNGGNRKGGRY
jgi:hypothetical protein